MSAGEQWRVTNAVSRQGYLDGITQSMETVDNLPWEEHKRTHQLMYDYADFQIWFDSINDNTIYSDSLTDSIRNKNKLL